MEQELIKKVMHSPTLNTILMVEETIKNADESIVTIPYIKEHELKYKHLDDKNGAIYWIGTNEG